MTNNPRYEQGNEDSFDDRNYDDLYNEEINVDIQDIQDLDYLQTCFDKFTSTIVYDNINVNELNRNRALQQQELRAGPGTPGDNIDDSDAPPVMDMKIASLEGYGELKETTDMIQLFRAVIGDAGSAQERTKRVNESLINYFALLGTQAHSCIDIDFVESLISVADLDTRDIHGQSIMHEVAREWSPDIAKLLLLKGINIDLADNWGRTPLFVAVAANHVAMVKWLVDNGADVNHKTIEGQGQSPIHYAAKHNAVEAFQTLMDYGANPLMRDDQDRTPFFVAAYSGHVKISKYMLDLDLPTVSYAKNGECTIDHIIGRLPNEMGTLALNQFIAKSTTSQNIKVYLSCLGKRRWKLLSQHHLNPTACKTDPPGPLEIILDRYNMEMVKHPAITQLIKTKTANFGGKYIYLNIFLHCLFTLIWTMSVSIFFSDSTWYSSDGVIILTFLGHFLTFFFIYKFYQQNKAEYKAANEERERLMKDCQLERKFCHPRWRTDQLNLDRNIEAASTITYSIFWDGWNIVEIISLSLTMAHAILTYIYIGMCDKECEQNQDTTHKEAFESSSELRVGRLYLSAVTIFFAWIRLNICFRYNQQIAPFIAMLSGCIASFIQIGFLFFEFFIPATVACWVIFGGKELYEEESEYTEIQNMIYQVYLLTIVGDYEYDPLHDLNRLAAQIFVGLYAVVVSIITINLYIALLSEAYSSISATSSATAYLQQARDIRQYERLFPEDKVQFEIHLNKYCAPMIVDPRDFDHLDVSSARVIIKEALRSVGRINQQMKQIIEDQEFLRKDVSTLNEKLSQFRTTFPQEKNVDLVDDFNDVRRNEERVIVRYTKKYQEKVDQLLQRMKGIPSFKM